MIVKTIVSNDRTFNQEDSKDGNNLLNHFVINLIREHAKYKNGCFELFACDLPYEDKKLFLSYLVDIDDYDYFTKNKTREKAAIKDYESAMQDEIDWRIGDVYRHDMEEMGMVLCRHKDNGEPFWRIR